MNNLNRNSCKRVWQALLLMGAIGNTWPVMAVQEAPSGAVDETIQAVTRTPKAQGLQVDFEPVRANYRAGEPIQFKVKGNLPFYLYLYNVDSDTGEAVMLFPNRNQTNNRIWPNRTHVLPGRTVEFYSDRAGIENLVMVASTEKLLEDLERYEALGPFAMGKATDFNETLRIKPRRILKDHQFVVRDFALKINGSQPDWLASPTDDGPAGDLPIAFISTPELTYREGDLMPLVFGANKQGWLQVYDITPDGAYERLVLKPVMANEAQMIRPRALFPYGLHRLVAIYSPTPELQDQLVIDVADGRFQGIVPGSQDAVLGVDLHRVEVTPR